MLAASDQSLGTQHGQSRLPDERSPIDPVTGIPRCWFPAWFLHIQVSVCTCRSSKGHPPVPGFPRTPAFLPPPKASNSQNQDWKRDTGVRGGGQGVSASMRGKRCKVRSRKTGLLPHLTHTPWLSHSMRSLTGLFVPLGLLSLALDT